MSCHDEISQAAYFSESQEIHFPCLTDQFFGLKRVGFFFRTISNEDADVVLGEMS